MTPPTLSALFDANAPDPQSIVLVLLDLAISKTEAGDLDTAGRIVSELSGSFKPKPEGAEARTLLRLHVYILRRLWDAAEGDAQGVYDALRILRHIRDTWRRAIALAASPAPPEAGPDVDTEGA